MMRVALLREGGTGQNGGADNDGSDGANDSIARNGGGSDGVNGGGGRRGGCVSRSSWIGSHYDHQQDFSDSLISSHGDGCLCSDGDGNGGGSVDGGCGGRRGRGGAAGGGASIVLNQTMSWQTLRCIPAD